MTNADGTDSLAFSPGEFEYQCTLVYGAWLEDDEGVADVGVGPVGEGGAGGGWWDGNFL